jgi:hypothetical protein
VQIKKSADSRDRLLYAEVTRRSFDELIEKLNEVRSKHQKTSISTSKNLHWPVVRDVAQSRLRRNWVVPKSALSLKKLIQWQLKHY